MGRPHSPGAFHHCCEAGEGNRTLVCGSLGGAPWWALAPGSQWGAEGRHADGPVTTDKPGAGARSSNAEVCTRAWCTLAVAHRLEVQRQLERRFCQQRVIVDGLEPLG